VKLLILCVLSVGITHYAYAGGGMAGNGGDVVVCENSDGAESVDLLDVFELKQSGDHIDLGASRLSLEEKMDIGIARIRALMPNQTRVYLKGAHEVIGNSAWINEQLQDIPDTGEVEIPANCRVTQIAIRNPNRLPFDKEFIIYKPLWNRLDRDNQAALLLHEVIYKDAKLNAHPKNSAGVRAINRFLIKEWNHEVSFVEFYYDYFLTVFNRNDFQKEGTTPDTLAPNEWWANRDGGGSWTSFIFLSPLSYSGYENIPCDSGRCLYAYFHPTGVEHATSQYGDGVRSQRTVKIYNSVLGWIPAVVEEKGPGLPYGMLSRAFMLRGNDSPKLVRFTEPFEISISLQPGQPVQKLKVLEIGFFPNGQIQTVRVASDSAPAKVIHENLPISVQRRVDFSSSGDVKRVENASFKRVPVDFMANVKPGCLAEYSNADWDLATAEPQSASLALAAGCPLAVHFPASERILGKTIEGTFPIPVEGGGFAYVNGELTKALSGPIQGTAKVGASSLNASMEYDSDGAHLVISGNQVIPLKPGLTYDAGDELSLPMADPRGIVVPLRNIREFKNERKISVFSANLKFSLNLGGASDTVHLSEGSGIELAIPEVRYPDVDLSFSHDQTGGISKLETKSANPAPSRFFIRYDDCVEKCDFGKPSKISFFSGESVRVEYRTFGDPMSFSGHLSDDVLVVLSRDSSGEYVPEISVIDPDYGFSLTLDRAFRFKKIDCAPPENRVRLNSGYRYKDCGPALRANKKDRITFRNGFIAELVKM
jgi:hypothetical protein